MILVHVSKWLIVQTCSKASKFSYLSEIYLGSILIRQANCWIFPILKYKRLCPYNIFRMVVESLHFLKDSKYDLLKSSIILKSTGIITSRLQEYPFRFCSFSRSSVVHSWYYLSWVNNFISYMCLFSCHFLFFLVSFIFISIPGVVAMWLKPNRHPAVVSKNSIICFRKI